jgi:two-component system, OmpR family, response regulator
MSTDSGTGGIGGMSSLSGATVLVVEDEPSITHVLTIALRFHHFEVMTAGGVREAAELARGTRPDAALVDVMLPDGDGRALARELRERWPQMAIVFVTARDAPAEIVGGLGLGDDYITKPFNIDEVIARLGAVLRRTLLHSPSGTGGTPIADHVVRARAPLRYGDLELDDTTYRVRRAGRSVDLTPTEYALLRFLVRNAGRVCTKEQLLKHVWQYGHHQPESTVVETYISYLRRKLAPLGPPLIATRRGVGYGLAGSGA